MTGVGKRSIVGGIMAVPAVLFLTYVLRSFRGEYYFSTYVVVGIVDVTASFIIGWILARGTQQGTSGGRLFRRMLFGSAAAWGIALLALAVLSATPLCVGQDNGDGNNNLWDCGFYVVLAAVFYSVPMVVGMGMAAAAASGILRKNKQEPLA